MNIIECIAVVFSLFSVGFTIKNDILSWPVGIVGIIFYGIHFYNLDLYGNMSLQVLFTLQSIYGWYNWNVIPKDVTYLSKKHKDLTLVLGSVLGGIGIFLLTLTGDKYPIFDGITVALSIIATVLLSYRKIDSWYYWIVADLFYIVFFFYIGDFLSAITYIVFLTLASYGLKEWQKL